MTPSSDRGNQGAEFLNTLDSTIQKDYDSLRRTQARYKRDLDKRIRQINSRLCPGEYISLNPADGGKTSNKLASLGVGPYRVLVNHRQAITINRDGVTERASTDCYVYAPPPTDALRMSTTNPLELADKVTEGTRYAVKRLLKHRVIDDGTTEFLINWADYNQKTWTACAHVTE